MPKLVTTEDFIHRSNALHNFKYNYDKVVYLGSTLEVCITCPIHGDTHQKPTNHTNGYGCSQCSHLITSSKLKENSKERDRVCRICGKSERLGRFSKGLCHLHYEQVRKNLIDEMGVVVDKSCYIDERGCIQKIKDTLRATIRECWWYREWVRDIIKLNHAKCFDCGKCGVRLVAHHDKESFSKILEASTHLYSNLEDQIKYCRSRHTLGMGACLCLGCHANRHKGQKVYDLLLNKSKNSVCLVCEEPVYCKNFCKLHYGRYRSGVYDSGGNKLRLLKHELPKPIGKVKLEKKILLCKVCGEKHYGLGFCLTHYNRYRIKQIDINGVELRPLKNFCVKGSTQVDKMVEHNGEVKTILFICRQLGISRRCMYKRLRYWDLDRALTEPKNNKNT